MKLILVLLVTALSGCAASVSSSSERSVSLQGRMNAFGEMQPLANVECARYGRKAAFKYSTDQFPSTYFYDCLL